MLKKRTTVSAVEKEILGPQLPSRRHNWPLIAIAPASSSSTAAISIITIGAISTIAIVVAAVEPRATATDGRRSGDHVPRAVRSGDVLLLLVCTKNLIRILKLLKLLKLPKTPPPLPYLLRLLLLCGKLRLCGGNVRTGAPTELLPVADHIDVASKKPAHGDVHHQEGDAAYLRAHVKGVRLVDGDGGEGEGADEQQHMGEDHEEVDEDVRIHHEDVPADAADQAAQLADDARAGEEDKADLGPALKKRVKKLQFFLIKRKNLP